MPVPAHPRRQGPARTRSFVAPSECESYAAGHHVHWIQALRTSNRPEIIAESWRGKLTALEGDLLTVARRDGSESRFRNHDVPRLRAIARSLPVGVLVNDQFAVLRIGSYVFSVHPEDEPWSPCILAHEPEASA